MLVPKDWKRRWESLPQGLGGSEGVGSLGDALTRWGPPFTGWMAAHEVPGTRIMAQGAGQSQELWGPTGLLLGGALGRDSPGPHWASVGAADSDAGWRGGQAQEEAGKPGRTWRFRFRVLSSSGNLGTETRERT